MLILEMVGQKLYSNQPLNFVVNLIKNGSSSSPKGYTSLSKNKDVAMDLDDITLGASYAGDTFITFDGNVLAKNNRLIPFEYNNFNFWAKNPKVFDYATGYKWSTDFNQFVQLNKKKLNDAVDLIGSIEDIDNLKNLVLTLTGSIAFEKEIAVASPFNYSPGCIINVKPDKQLSANEVNFLTQAGIKVVGQKEIASEFAHGKDNYNNRLPENKAIKHRQYKQLKSLIGKPVRGNKITSKVIVADAYVYPGYFNGKVVGYYGSLVLAAPNGEIVNYCYPPEWLSTDFAIGG